MEKPTLREEVLAEALLDAYILLSRGYPRKPALELVYARWGLNRWERLAVYHCSHGYETILKVRASTACPRGSLYAVDGYNVAVSLECIRRGIPVVICPDGYVRDVMGGWKPGPEAAETLTEYLEALERHLKPEGILVYLDARVSKSGLLASRLRRMGFTAATSRTTDKTIIEAARRRGATPITSDIVVLERVGGCNHLTHYALLRGAEVVDTPLLLREGLEKTTGLWGLGERR